MSFNALGLYCYQESADVAASCGGLDTGNYYQTLCTNCDNWKDGSWATYSIDGTYYVNYTIPENALSAVWKTDTSYTDTEHDISNCTNYNDIYGFKMNLVYYWNGSHTVRQERLDCLNSSGDYGTRVFTSAEYTGVGYQVAEEAINWTLAQLLINVYDQEDGSTITDNVTITLIDDEGLTEYYTTNGTYIFNELDADNYTVTLESTNYSKAIYYITVSESSSQVLNAYLLDSNVTDQVTFTLQDSNDGSYIEDATISVSRVVGDEWEVVTVLSTDVTGRTAFYYETDVEYNFIVSKSGYASKSFSLNPILFDSYTVKIAKNISEVSEVDYSGISIYFTPKEFYDNTNHNISFLFADPIGTLEYYGYSFTYKTLTVSDSGNNAYGEQFQDNITILNASFGDYVDLEFYYKTTGGEVKEFNFTYYVGISQTNNTIISNKDKTYGMGEFERTLVSVIITVFVAGGVAFFAGALASGLMAFVVMGYLIKIGFLNFWAGIISMILLFIVVVWRSS